jgi:hypothetical protein
MRVGVYVLLLLIGIASVLLKQQILIREREKEVISPIGEWAKFGKPVNVLILKKQDFYSFTKITIEKAGDFFVSYVPQSDKKKIKVGQGVYREANKRYLCGTVSSVSDERDFSTGLFKIVLTIDKDRDRLNQRDIVFIHTDTLPDVLALPYSAVDLVEPEAYSSLVVNGRVQKVTVKTGALDREAIVITDGLKEGDHVIFEGQTLAEDGSRVRVGKEVAQ